MSYFDMYDTCYCLDLDHQFKNFSKSNSKSLLKQYLSYELFNLLKSRHTPTYSSSIKDIIQSGMDNMDSQIGVYAPDAESYVTFEELFTPIIESYHDHKLIKPHPKSDFGSDEQLKQFTNLDPMGLYVKKIVLSCSRNIIDYPFTPLLTYKMFQEIEKIVKKIFMDIVDHELSGSYFSYRSLSQNMEKYLSEQKFLFQDTNKYLRSARAYQCWPIGRGIYVNNIHDFMVWINEADHLRFVSMDNNGHLGCIYRRLIAGIQTLEKKLEYHYNTNIGYVTLCPSNLGTALTALIYIKLPNLSKNMENLKSILKNHNLCVGVKDTLLGNFPDQDVVVITNKKKLGVTEYEILNCFQAGVLEVMNREVEYL